MTPQYSIIIPVYRSAAWLEELADRIFAVMDTAGYPDCEVIMVNDRSPDTETWPALERAAAKHSRLRGIDLVYNVGQFRALMCGMQQAQGQLILTMDDDFQHPPEELPKLITALADQPDLLCVMGDYQTRGQSPVRRLGSAMFSRILNRAYGKPSNLRTTSFRIMRLPLVEAILAYRTAKPQLGPLIVSITRQVANIPVRHEPRKAGSSNYNLFSLMRNTIDSVVYASTAPLRFLSTFGLLCAGAAFMIGLGYLVRWAAGGIGVPGFTSQILLIIFFGGMTLLGLGVLGEYVARIIGEVTGPERFQINRTCGTGGPDE